MLAPVAVLGSYDILVAGPSRIVHSRCRSWLRGREERSGNIRGQGIVVGPALSRTAFHQREHLSTDVYVVPGECHLPLHEHGKVGRVELKLMQRSAGVPLKQAKVVARYTGIGKRRKCTAAGLGQSQIHRVAALGKRRVGVIDDGSEDHRWIGVTGRKPSLGEEISLGIRQQLSSRQIRWHKIRIGVVLAQVVIDQHQLALVEGHGWHELMTAREAAECTSQIIGDRAIVDGERCQPDASGAEHDAAREGQHHDSGIGRSGNGAAL